MTHHRSRHARAATLPRKLWPLLLAFTAAVLLPGIQVRADGPADNEPARVRPVPPPGVEPPADVRAALEAKLPLLGRAVQNLESSPETADLAADVRIYYNAVRYALHYGEFFKPAEFKVAEQQLATGLARAAAAAKGAAPWRSSTGPGVRGYVSEIDGSTQPYGLLVPAGYRPGAGGKWRLDVWFHGRGETLSELNFIQGVERSGGPFVSDRTFVLQPYGRYCNANKFAGEIDLLEAIQEVKKLYPIDDDRIIVRGFSMGGAACWQFAAHYADRWAAAAPGAGFSETPEFLRVFQNEAVQPAWWERKLWQWYDCPEYAPNFFNLPTVAYSGEIDRQKQAADVMEAALAREGIRLAHLIGPQTAHSYHPATRLEVAERIDSIAAAGRNPMPRRIRLRTPTLRYNKMYWITLNALEEHWKPASVDAEVTSGGEVNLKTSGVRALTIDMPAGRAPFELDAHPRLRIDDQRIEAPPVMSDRSWRVELRRDGKRWISGAAPAAARRVKKHGLQGPIDDAFMQPFLFVRPSRLPAEPAVAAWVEAEMNRAIREWRRQFRGEARVKQDIEVTAEDIQRYNLVLWGDPEGNRVLGRLAHDLPLGWTQGEIRVGDRAFPGKNHVLLAIYPNPLNVERYVVLNSGFTFREYDYLNNARQTPRLPDWAVIDTTTPPGTRYPGRVADADFFGEEWQLKEPASERGLR